MRRRQRDRIRGRVLPGGKVSYMLDDEHPLVMEAESIQHPDNLLVFRPEDRHLIPEAGAWLMLTRQLPPMEHGIDQKAVPGTVLYGMRGAEADAFGFLPSGRYCVDVPVPFGFKVWPYEYAVVAVPDLLAMWQGGELLFHAAAMSSPQLSDTLFYCRSRGIGLQDALVMALGTVQGPVGWFEPAPRLREWCVEMGRMRARVGILTGENHRRREAARQRAGGAS